MIRQILSCDWGTSSFRLRLVNIDDRRILNEVKQEKGISTIYNEWINTNKPETERLNFYGTFLQSILDKYFTDKVKGIPIIVSGMVSSTIGMKELAYAEIPFDLSGKKLITELIEDDHACRHKILLISGLKTGNDAMRGEETMLLGCDLKPGEDVLAIFPGTHSKHVLIHNNTVVDFKTFMTGEVFDLLSIKSILSKSVTKNYKYDDNSFIKGVKEGAQSNFLNSIFHTRTNQLFKKLTDKENYHFLSGLVIGYELKELLLSEIAIHLVCTNDLCRYYLTALKTLNGSKFIHHHDADEVLIKAHCKLSGLLDDE
jgi:2-dehydro-3-deoxygalactonokinase